MFELPRRKFIIGQLKRGAFKLDASHEIGRKGGFKEFNKEITLETRENIEYLDGLRTED